MDRLVDAIITLNYNFNGTDFLLSLYHLSSLEYEFHNKEYTLKFKGEYHDLLYIISVIEEETEGLCGGMSMIVEFTEPEGGYPNDS